MKKLLSLFGKINAFDLDVFLSYNKISRLEEGCFDGIAEEANIHLVSKPIWKNKGSSGNNIQTILPYKRKNFSI